MQILINFLKNSQTAKINYLFVLLFIVFNACKGNSVDDPKVLAGRWVESTGRGDTLIFDNNTSFVKAKRGFEIKNGIRFSKIGSGLWEYKLLANYQMDVRYSLSFSLATTKAHVELKGGNLYVANFYELETPAKYELRVFDKR